MGHPVLIPCPGRDPVDVVRISAHPPREHVKKGRPVEDGKW